MESAVVQTCEYDGCNERAEEHELVQHLRRWSESRLLLVSYCETHLRAFVKALPVYVDEDEGGAWFLPARRWTYNLRRVPRPSIGSAGTFSPNGGTITIGGFFAAPNAHGTNWSEAVTTPFSWFGAISARDGEPDTAQQEGVAPAVRQSPPSVPGPPNSILGSRPFRAFEGSRSP